MQGSTLVARSGRSVSNDDVRRLALALFTLTQRGECPGWVNGAGRELLRDFGVLVAVI